ncbi:uncharacterized protein BJ171DRAFT_616990 [Polychytrium aggregatum]|uniref:uncharacterized protein n=1 Tax=Polychytrium aggregatum TaxID=110093 RepID=UPI0022FE9C58|nr:uncharacterized protein BJ171DRAFT_616990 [Polychytrium aggregatum]KAI9205062.1 hypothetical protein BJ171DRAFT_616990 [Polychytrium aggregatum]
MVVPDHEHSMVMMDNQFYQPPDASWISHKHMSSSLPSSPMQHHPYQHIQSQSQHQQLPSPSQTQPQQHLPMQQSHPSLLSQSQHLHASQQPHNLHMQQPSQQPLLNSAHTRWAEEVVYSDEYLPIDDSHPNSQFQQQPSFWTSGGYPTGGYVACNDNGYIVTTSGTISTLSPADSFGHFEGLSSQHVVHLQHSALLHVYPPDFASSHFPPRHQSLGTSGSAYGSYVPTTQSAPVAAPDGTTYVAPARHESLERMRHSDNADPASGHLSQAGLVGTVHGPVSVFPESCPYPGYGKAAAPDHHLSSQPTPAAYGSAPHLPTKHIFGAHLDHHGAASAPSPFQPRRRTTLSKGSSSLPPSTLSTPTLSVAASPATTALTASSFPTPQSQIMYSPPSHVLTPGTAYGQPPNFTSPVLLGLQSISNQTPSVSSASPAQISQSPLPFAHDPITPSAMPQFFNGSDNPQPPYFVTGFSSSAYPTSAIAPLECSFRFDQSEAIEDLTASAEPVPTEPVELPPSDACEVDNDDGEYELTSPGEETECRSRPSQSPEDPEVVTIERPPPDGPQIWRCTPFPGCDKQFNTRAGLRYHLHTTHKVTCRIVTRRNVGQYGCQLSGCSKTFKTRAGLRYHLTHHHNDDASSPRLRPLASPPVSSPPSEHLTDS